MKNVSFDEVHEMFSLLLEKVDRIEAVICNSEDFTGSNLLTTSETVKFKGISSAQLRKLADKGKMPCYQSFGNKSYFKKSEVSK